MPYNNKFSEANSIKNIVSDVLINRGELKDKTEYLDLIAPILLSEYQFLNEIGLNGEEPSILAHSVSRAPNIEMKRISLVEVKELLGLVNRLENNSSDNDNKLLIFFTHFIMNVLWTDFCLLNEITFEEVMIKMKSLIPKND